MACRRALRRAPGGVARRVAEHVATLGDAARTAAAARCERVRVREGERRAWREQLGRIGGVASGAHLQRAQRREHEEHPMLALGLPPAPAFGGEGPALRSAALCRSRVPTTAVQIARSCGRSFAPARIVRLARQSSAASPTGATDDDSASAARSTHSVTERCICGSGRRCAAAGRQRRHCLERARRSRRAFLALRVAKQRDKVLQHRLQ